MDTLTEIIATRRRGVAQKAEFSLSKEDLTECFELMEKIHLSRPVASYIARLVGAAHPGNPEEVKAVTRFVSYGPSPRAAIAMAESARAAALLNGRGAVSFEDVKRVAPAVLNHRLVLNYNAKLEKKSAAFLVEEIVKHVPCADSGLPEGLTFEKE